MKKAYQFGWVWDCEGTLCRVFSFNQLHGAELAHRRQDNKDIGLAHKGVGCGETREMEKGQAGCGPGRLRTVCPGKESVVLFS